MPQSSHCRVSFTNNNKYNLLTYDISTGSGDSDAHSLLGPPEAPENKINRVQVLKIFCISAFKSPLTLVIIIDILTVIILTSLFCTMNALRCDDSTRSDILDMCEPFEPVDKVIVDLNFGLLVHCDVPKSCVAYAQSLMEKQGFNYNFILGDEELVYVGKGYQCRSDALRLQMLVTRYTWDPKQPVYKVPDEVVMRYAEVISEGLRCGKLAVNYTVSATCSVYGEWCGADNIREHLPWAAPYAKDVANNAPPRHAWCEPSHPRGHPFLAFDQYRVYEAQYRLKACNFTPSCDS